MNAILLCRTHQVPTPEQVAQALCCEGYQAFVEVEKGPATSVAAEIRYAPGRMPIIVNFYNDLYDAPDEKDYDYFEWMEELMPDAEARKAIRRFIFIDAMENADAKAFQEVVNFIGGQTNAAIIMHKHLGKQ